MAPEDDPRLDVQESEPRRRPEITLTLRAEDSRRVVITITDCDVRVLARMTFANGTWDGDHRSMKSLTGALCKLAVRRFGHEYGMFEFDDEDDS